MLTSPSEVRRPQLIDVEPDYRSWALRRDQREYLEQHKATVIRELKYQPPEELCHDLRVSLKCLMGALQKWGLWEDHVFVEPPRRRNHLPDAPKLEKSRGYLFRSWLQQKAGNDNRLSGERMLKYLGEVKAKAPGRRIFLFQNVMGAKESFTIFQLKESLLENRDGL